MRDNMIGAVVYELEAENGERVSDAQGRLLHGALFLLLKTVNPGFAALLHDGMNVKPFSSGPLELPKGTLQEGQDWILRAGDFVYWRITSLDSTLFDALLAVSPGTKIPVGRLCLVLRRIIADHDVRSDTGVIKINKLMDTCLAVPKIHTITFHFRSPVSFRVDKSDYPLPVPVLVFSSLADKWIAAEMPAVIERNEIRADAERVFPLAWRGETRRLYLGRDRGITGFVGRFSYDVSQLDVERQRIFLLLARFAEFSGVGRLTAQGMGQTRMTFRQNKK